MVHADDRRLAGVFECGGSSLKLTVGEIGDEGTWRSFVFETPSNITTGGAARFKEAIDSGLQRAGIKNYQDLERTFFAVAGNDLPEDEQIIRSALSDLKFNAASADVRNDMDLGIYPFQDTSDFQGVVISGTGMNAGARVNGSDQFFVSGGTRALFGDRQGAAFGIGLSILTYVADCFLDCKNTHGNHDFSLMPTLVKKICSKVECESLSELLALSVPEEVALGEYIRKVSSIAKLVSYEASRDIENLSPENIERGDRHAIIKCREILDETGRYLGGRFLSLLRSTQVRSLNITHPHISLIGSVITKDSYVYESFMKVIQEDPIALNFIVKKFPQTDDLHVLAMKRLSEQR